MKTFIQFLKESQSYDDFFKSKLDKFEVSSPEELSDEKKKEFFSEVETEWTGDTD